VFASMEVDAHDLEITADDLYDTDQLRRQIVEEGENSTDRVQRSPEGHRVEVGVRASPVEITQSGSPIPDDEPNSEPNSEEDKLDEDEFRALGPGGSTVFGGPLRGGLNFGNRRADNLLDFIDEVSDNISSYLGFLEERQKGVVYDRHEQAETARFREYLKQFHATTMKRATEETNEPVPVAEAFSAVDRPCAPPKNVPFEALQRMPDGKERLSFSACFECGNLALAKSDTPTQYTLLLDFDVNTSGYTQWFYYGVRGGTKGLRVTFKIVNLSKADSHFSRGMKPVVWSEKAARGWERGCSEVSYYANEHKRGRCDGESSSTFHTLEFSYTFEHDYDTVFFAYHYPYTYSYLQDLIAWLVSHPYASKFVRRGTLCRTIGGLACEYLMVGDPDCEPPPDEPPKPLAVATARVHPGESNSSWMMQGLIQFLCSPTAEAQALRERCTWLVIPMLNPDGVIQGNYRCGLAGCDLNRVFSKPHHRLHPTIWHLKERIRHHKVEVYIDLHGHSKKEGVFLYGGHYDNNDRRNAEVRLLPRLCSLASDDFKYWQCVFSVQDSKLTTARLVAFLQMSISQAYTVEASFANCGPREIEEDDGAPSTGTNITTGDLKEIKVARPNSFRRSNSIVSQLSSSKTMETSENSDDDGDSSVLLRRNLRHHKTNDTINSDSALEGSNSEDESRESTWQRQTSQASAKSVNSTRSRHVDKTYQEPKSQQESQPRPEKPKADMSASRLELVGPTILRSLHCSWQLTKGLHKPKSKRGFNYGSASINGVENIGCSHLHYERLTLNTAREVFTRLLTKREDEKYLSLKRAASTPALEDNEDKGSDSEPDADEKNPQELKKIHKRLLQKLKKRKDTFAQNDAKPVVEEDNEPKEFRTIIAFGKTLRLPVVNGRVTRPENISTNRPTTGKRGQPPPLPPCETEAKVSRPRSAPMSARAPAPGIPGAASSGDAPSEEAPVEETLEREASSESAQSKGLRDKRQTYHPSGSRPLSGHGSATVEMPAMRRNPLAIASLVPSQMVVRSPRTGTQLSDESLEPLQVAGSDEPTNTLQVIARTPFSESITGTSPNASGSAGARALRSNPAMNGGVTNRYASSDVRNFVEVKSIKPQTTSRRTAEQLRRGQSGQSPVRTTFELPSSSAVAGPEKKWTANALHRIPLDRCNGSTPTPKDNASKLDGVRTKASVTIVGTQPQQCSRVLATASASSSKPGRSSPAPWGQGKSNMKARCLADDKVGREKASRRKSVQISFEERAVDSTVDTTPMIGRVRASSIGAGPSQVAQVSNPPLHQDTKQVGKDQARSLYYPTEHREPSAPYARGNTNTWRNSDGSETSRQPDTRKSPCVGWSEGFELASAPGRSRTVHWAEEPSAVNATGEYETQSLWTLAEKAGAVEVANPVPLSSLLANSSLRPKPPTWMESRIRTFSEPPIGNIVGEIAAPPPKAGQSSNNESHPHRLELLSQTVEMSQMGQSSKIGVASHNVCTQSGLPLEQRGGITAFHAQFGQVSRS